MSGKVIAFTKVALPGGYLGNMAPYPITDENGVVWRTSEALFQALRLAPDDPVREEIRAQKSPMSAKMIAKKYADKRVIEPCSGEDIANMKRVLSLKLAQHPQVLTDLRATGDAIIIEDCTKRPGGTGLFWGAKRKEDGSWDGENHLGVLWMVLREEHKEG